jgi:hypothetical protein
VDAAYALHGDSKSQTRAVVYMGRTMVFMSSKKQKCVRKSPMEAELVALTDNLGFVEIFQDFVNFLVMKKVQIPVQINIVYQDCNAVVSLVTRGGGVTRTKHLRVRMNLGKEMVDEGKIKVTCMNMEIMIADGFTKSYDPKKRR